MKNRFLKATHWQLFTLGFGVPILLQIVAMVFLFVRISNHGDISPTFTFRLFGVVTFINILFMFVLFGWLWSIGRCFYSYLPEGTNLKIGLFKVFLVFPIVYIAIFLSFIGVLFPIIAIAIAGMVSIPILLIVVVVHFFSIFCVGYSVFFVAKTIKSLELEKAATFNDFIGEFFLILLFPIGIWILQPRINELYKKYELEI